MRAYVLASALAAGAVLAALPASAEESLTETASAFGVRPSVLDVSLSPDGTKIAYIAPGPASDEYLYVVDLRGNATPKAVTFFDQPDQELYYCDWATNERLVCGVYGYGMSGTTLINFRRMISVASDGSDITVLSADDGSDALGIQQTGGEVVALDVPGQDNRILMTRDFVKEFSTGTRLASEEEGLGVEYVDITNGRRNRAEKPDREAVSYIADETGTIRLKLLADRDNAGLRTGRRDFFVRPQGESNWVRLSAELPGFRPRAVSSRDNLLYGFESRNGYDALVSVALDGSNTKQLVLGRDDVDVDGLIRIGRARRVVGASYATEKRQVRYFDEELGGLASALAKALPGQPLINIVDASADESKLLLIASSDTDPGMVYLLDRTSNELSPLLPMRDALENRPMAPMTPVSFQAADGTQIPAYLTRPIGAEGPGPAVVLPHGGPGSRDEWGFDWLVQFFAARGFAVLQPNFRGSAGYGEAWFGRNGFQQWETAIGDINDAGRWLVAEGIADPETLAGVGWSYGGYGVLQSQVVDPDLFKAIVAIAPVTDLAALKEESRGYINFATYSRFVGDGPHVAAGSPARHAERFSAPVMLVHGTMDLNVGVAQSKTMRRRLEEAGVPVEYVEYDGLDHHIDHSWARANMLLKIGTFLEEHLDLD